MELYNQARFNLSLEEIKNAASIHETPLYLYDFNKIEEQYRTLKNYLPSNFTIHYAVKANSNLAICKRMANLGSSADISSVGELYAVQQAGFLPKQIVFTGPGKTNKDLLAGLEVGCGLFIVESLGEAERLNRLAKQEGIIQDILVRINPLYRTSQSCETSQGAQHCEKEVDVRAQIQLISHKSSKFGIDEERAEEALEAIRSLPNIRLKGIHVFTESNVLNYEDLLASWRNTIYIANRLRKQGHLISHIDFGGGIGIPYNTKDQSFDVQAFGQGLQAIFDENPFQYNCLVEIGRFIVGGAGCYVTEVVDIKHSRGKEFVILNGGIHQLFRISPSMVEASKFLDILDSKEAAAKKVTLGGKLPTALDIFVEGVDVPKDLKIGDQLVIYNCGAYGFNHSLTNFNLHPYPAEAAYDNGQLKLIRSRGKVKDFFIHQERLVASEDLVDV